jgi:hypothetical protein
MRMGSVDSGTSALAGCPQLNAAANGAAAMIPSILRVMWFDLPHFCD